MPTHDTVTAAAVAACEAGLAVMPPREDGTKRPLGEWKHWQTERPGLEQIATWYATPRTGIGLICGQVSGGLEVLELEGAAVQQGFQHELRAAAQAAGIEDVLDRVLNGCLVQSPSGGYHLMYRCPTPEGNQRLATTLDPGTGELTLISETRGEGGYIVTAPTNGAVHPSGQPWTQITGSLATIAELTQPERDALLAAARTLHQEPVQKPATTRHVRSNDLRPGDEYNQATTPDTTLALLERHGWQTVTATSDNWFLRRPGKNEGHSATLHRQTGVLYVFTTSTVFAPGGHSPFHVLAVLEHAGDHSEAARGLRPSDPSRPAVNVAPKQGTNLPNDFWETRPELDWIRQAAHSRNRSADTVLHSVLARIAAHIPHHYHLPPIVGAPAALTLLVAIGGPSGTGKSSAYHISTELLPTPPKGPAVLDGLPIGSGEGLAETFFTWQPDPDNAKRKIRTQTHHNAMFYVDEGAALAAIGGRQGSTLLATLRTVFTGGATGQTNASQETRRILPAHTYTIGLVAAITPDAASKLLDDATGGTPQRFTWVSPIDPATGDATWPGPLGWQPPAATLITGATGTPIGIPTDIATEIRDHDLARIQGTIAVPLLDSHAPLVRLKLAALLNLLQEQPGIDHEAWQLSDTMLDTSNAVRTWTAELAGHDAAARNQAAGHRQAQRDHARDQVTEALTTADLAKWITDRAHTNPGTTTRDLRRATTKRRRPHFDAALDYATTHGWVEVREVPGERGGSPKREVWLR